MNAAARKIAALFPGHWDRNYVATKLRTDPLYSGLAEKLRGSDLPLLDLGCGLGLLGLLSAGRGIEVPIHGSTTMRGKSIRQPRRRTSPGKDLAFATHDARSGLPDHSGNVSILDILQFFTPAEQETLLQLAASRVAPGGKLIIRSGLRDASWRFKIAVLGDLAGQGELLDESRAHPLPGGRRLPAHPFRPRESQRFPALGPDALQQPSDRAGEACLVMAAPPFIPNTDFSSSAITSGLGDGDLAPRFVGQAAHGDAVNPARGDREKRRQAFRGDVDGEAVHGNPFPNTDTDRGELAVLHPDAG